MIEKAYGKINISLNLVGRRADGYHELDMVMVPVNVYDTVYMSKSDEMSFESDSELRWDESNIMYKAVELMKHEYNIKSNYKIRLIKRIPAQAGMAGGSADCAAVLRLINRIEKLGLTAEQLAQTGVRLGADVPFCIYQQAARVKGIGERIRVLADHEKYQVILIKPQEGVSTAEAFRSADNGECEHPDMDLVEEKYLKHELTQDVMGNSLQQPAIKLVPVIADIINECRKAGFDKVLMTGSGSTVFVLHDGESDVAPFVRRMKKKYIFVINTQII